MEELRTGEVLEEEIREDARKKAERILRQADKECEALKAEAAARSDAEIAGMQAAAREKSRARAASVMARLPLERKRMRLAWAEKTLQAVLARTMAGLPDEAVDDILIARLKDALPAFAGRKAAIAFPGYRRAAPEARALAVLPGSSIGPVRDEGGDGSPGIMVESADGKLRFRASLASAFAYLAEERRGEMAEALFGKEGQA